MRVFIGHNGSEVETQFRNWAVVAESRIEWLPELLRAGSELSTIDVMDWDRRSDVTAVVVSGESDRRSPDCLQRR